MTDTATRLTRREARFAAQDLMYRYAECVDLARFEELGALGALDANAPMRGASQIRIFYAATHKVHSDGKLRTQFTRRSPPPSRQSERGASRAQTVRRSPARGGASSGCPRS